MKIGLRGQGRTGSGRDLYGSEASPGNPVSFPGKHPPPPTPKLTSEVNRPRSGGVSYTIWWGFLYDTYPDVS